MATPLSWPRVWKLSRRPPPSSSPHSKRLRPRMQPRQKATQPGTGESQLTPLNRDGVTGLPGAIFPAL